MTNSERTLEKRRRYKARIVQTMGGKCQCCGYCNYDGALELHHIDPSQKAFSICEKTYIAWEKLKTELQKCILVCANCHREIEAGLITVTESSFNEEIYNQILQEIKESKTLTKHYCIDCGKEIASSQAVRCVECGHKAKRISERPTREELKKMIREYSFVQLGKQFNVSDNSIRKWCDSYSLPRTKKEINSYSNIEWEKI